MHICFWNNKNFINHWSQKPVPFQIQIWCWIDVMLVSLLLLWYRLMLYNSFIQLAKSKFLVSLGVTIRLSVCSHRKKSKTNFPWNWVMKWNNKKVACKKQSLHSVLSFLSFPPALSLFPTKYGWFMSYSCGVGTPLIIHVGAGTLLIWWQGGAVFSKESWQTQKKKIRRFEVSVVRLMKWNHMQSFRMIRTHLSRGTMHSSISAM
jgi:hypothetical protein